MGERHSDGGRPGRRHVHPGGDTPHAARSADVPAPGATDARLEASLVAALRAAGPVDPAAEQRALAAFRTARDEGLHGPHRARTRRRDDWRPREPRRLGLSVKATLSVFVASLALGGVAVAAIGAADSSSHSADADKEHAKPGASAPERAGAGASAGSSAAPSARPDHPDTAKDTLAHCRAYEQVRGRGKALDSTAWQRLLTAAGGEDQVTAYCADQLARAAESRSNGQGGSGQSSSGQSGSGQGAGQGNGRSNGRNAGNGTSTDAGTTSGNSGNANNSSETSNSSETNNSSRG
ncbi:hypothetical protein ACGFYV_29010 [Streptomyces sp. NPDC048297]|uniref:hypothetical protein n=1 Tax=Streptomyces sp. NPDC048297 TaxID=3365531 RepID=UPI003721423A